MTPAEQIDEMIAEAERLHAARNGSHRLPSLIADLRMCRLALPLGRASEKAIVESAEFVMRIIRRDGGGQKLSQAEISAQSSCVSNVNTSENDRTEKSGLV